MFWLDKILDGHDFGAVALMVKISLFETSAFIVYCNGLGSCHIVDCMVES
jgi:hypothetical protein